MILSTKKSGFSLLTSLLLLAALTVVGLAIMRSGILSEKQSANVQEKSVTFHSAQSANNATIESYRYDQTILAQAVTLSPNATLDTCLDEKGKVTMNCTTPTSIDKSGGILLAQTKTEYKECLKAQKCTGNSSGLFSDNTIGCNVFEHDGEGWLDKDGDAALDADETASQIDQWSLLISACS
ncbi:PilX N-terminal domain-containing pilus assembly protein [Kangiella sp. HZ709]|uniref:PilX N-terminal domain-containing pilus assembly protein n=1 Tax=Kangiella sp. HZ709 TaxID=2666328 RepID=UPI0012B11FB7|nr:PilX N-terminal domain-containing pilus assembly protein [Kangiella sp. HZ709]MRX27097.1 hypothetical protein [Kangiella sp. HZ709]